MQSPGEDKFIPKIIKTTNSEFEALKENLVRPFKLEKGRLFRAEIYLTEDKKYLFTDFHHIIADGNSYDIIFEDINKASEIRLQEDRICRLIWRRCHCLFR